MYPFKPYGFPVVSNPVALLYSRERGERHAKASPGISRRLITNINLAIVSLESNRYKPHIQSNVSRIRFQLMGVLFNNI